MLVCGMIRVVKINVKRIVEDSYCFLERNTILLEINPRLFIIPLPRHDA